MKRIFIFFLLTAAVLTIGSCSKKDTSTTTDNKNTNTTTGNNTTTQNTDVKKNALDVNMEQIEKIKKNEEKDMKDRITSTSAFAVKNIGNQKNANELIDFTWMEGGTEKKLSDYKGKVILINFWATWCGPCKHELPSLSQISGEMAGKDFKMIGVSGDEERAAVDNFLSATPLAYTIVNEPSSQLVMHYMSATGQQDNVIPQTYIIDKKGKIVETIIGSRSKDDFVKLINKYL